MSLLNDALRAAEKRQSKPGVASAYAGVAPSTPGRRGWLVPALLLIIAVLLMALVYGMKLRNEGSAPATAVQLKSASSPEVDPGLTKLAPNAGKPDSDDDESSVPGAGATVVTEKAAEPEPEQTTARKTQPPVAVEEPFEISESKPEPMAVSKLANAESAPSDQAAPDEPTPVPAVKQIRETPEAIDREVSREIAVLLSEGETRRAEALLREVTQNQLAPSSRSVFARAMIVEGDLDRAMPWLSGVTVEQNPDLRLLKSRALLSQGELSGALEVLLRDTPPVQQATQYRVTLATLLQQDGKSEEAARHWSELLAMDDSRPAWWVGLAIALEDSGEIAGAVKAYQQAVALPGLSTALAEYVRKRLMNLRAG